MKGDTKKNALVNKTIVFDADSLFMLINFTDYKDYSFDGFIKNLCLDNEVILTPNIMELSRLSGYLKNEQVDPKSFDKIFKKIEDLVDNGTRKELSMIQFASLQLPEDSPFHILYKKVQE